MGRHKYDGEWSDGFQCGRGVMTFISGDVYEGCFREGLPHGQGKFIQTIHSFPSTITTLHIVIVVDVVPVFASGVIPASSQSLYMFCMTVAAAYSSVATTSITYSVHVFIY